MASPVVTMPTVSPLPNQNQADRRGQAVSTLTEAQQVIKAHQAGLRARRQRDLLSEKFLLHIDGSGDFQWADIFYGERIEIPRSVSEYRKTENLLRPIVDNAVAHHTTMPSRYYSDTGPDRRSRDQALIDSLWANDLAQRQDFNGLFADALYMAMASGFCPVHAYWRDDGTDAYEPVSYGQGQGYTFRPGMIDCWLGNPFDHVFDRAAKRGSTYWSSYGRVVPADLVRKAFGHIKGVEGLQGTTRIPSAATFQRIARNWRSTGLGIHGSAVLEYRQGTESDEELMVLLCRETMPGVLTAWPYGRLQIIAVPGTVDFRNGTGATGGAIQVVNQPLPGGDFSWSLFYSHHRVDDIHGKPWVEDLDDVQVALNISISERWGFVKKLIEAPIVGPGGAMSEDMADVGGFDYIELEPSAAGWRPRVLEWSNQVIPALDNEIKDKRSQLYTLGGYQASSRGESLGSRTPYRTVVALQQADNTVHGPVNVRYRRSACDFAAKCHKQMKMYGDVPWLVNIVGDEYAHLVEPYIDKTKLSDRTPKFKMINAFGPSPELRAQEILELMGTRGADGEVFLSTEEARRLYPNHELLANTTDPKAVKLRRARTVAQAFLNVAKQERERFGLDQVNITDPRVAQLALRVFMLIESQYPRMRDDDLMAHLNAYSEITQDETADPVARMALMRRQDLYFQWQAAMAQQAAGAMPRQGQPGGLPGARPPAGLLPPAGGTGQEPSPPRTAMAWG